MAIIINNNIDKARDRNAAASDPKHSRLDWKATASICVIMTYLFSATKSQES